MRREPKPPSVDPVPLHPFESRLAGEWPPSLWADITVVVAVSGGPDSVALLRAMHAIKQDGPGQLRVAHLNHHLRGGQSTDDQRFVEDLCRQLDLACDVGSIPPGKLNGRGSNGLEAAARAARHEFLQHVASLRGARYVATAHTADDQAETILHRVLRGTGISGLSGIRRSRRFGPCTLIRPLLGVRRAELLTYLHDRGQAYRIDASNADTRFTRNRIRHQLLPQLAEQFNPRVVDALLRLGSLAGEVQQVVDSLVQDYYRRAVYEGGPAGIQIAATSLRGVPRYLLRELLITAWRRQGWPLQAMGCERWGQLAEMLRAAAGEATAIQTKQMFPGTVLAEIGDNTLYVRRTGPPVHSPL